MNPRASRFLRRAAARITLLVLALLTVTASDPAHAQRAAVQGIVIDQSSAHPLLGATVVLQQDSQEIRSAVTDRYGLFQVAGLAAGIYRLRIISLGYSTHEETIALAPGERLTANRGLSLDPLQLEGMNVSAQDPGAVRRDLGGQTITARDIARIPTPAASGDIVGYLQTTPGVVSTGDRGGQLFIRGGEPTQNYVQLDGMLLYQPFHILGFYSAFPSDILSRSDIYAGGYGAKFGERISSVIDVWTREGNKRRFAGAVAASPFIATLPLEGPIVRDRVSFLASVRESMVERGAEPLLGEPLPFAFGDVFAKLHAELNARTRLALTGIRTYDRGTLAEPDAGAPAEEVRWTNEAVGLRYLLLPRILPVSADLRLSHSRFDSELGPQGDPSRSSSIWETNLSLDGTFFSPRIETEAGLVLRMISSDTELGGTFQNTEFKGSRIDHLAFYVEPEWTLGNGLRIRPGALFLVGDAK